MKLSHPKTGAILLALTMTASLAACGTSKTASAAETAAVAATANIVTDGATDTTDLFTDRDLTQTADLTDAVYETLSDGDTLTITDEGVWVLSGEAENAQIIVEADDSAKVQLVLDGLHVTNADAPAIYVKSADKVFVTTTDSDNALAVTGAFTADGETNTDAVIFSKDDLVLNGTGTLNITSTDNGVACKDDLKITGGTYVIDCDADALEANDSVTIADGSFTITAASDGVQGTTVTQIDGGTLAITAAEGIEATYVQINGGSVTIAATDDGVNASQKSAAVSPCVEITGGELTVTMAQGDTDAIDSNGSIIVSGGTIDITAQFAFDFDTTAEHTGGTITVNGETVSEITSDMMMGGPGQMGQMQGMPGQMPGGPGGMGHP